MRPTPAPCSPRFVPHGFGRPALLLIALLLLGGRDAAYAQGQWSQRATLSGFVTDAANGEPLAGANVVVQHLADSVRVRGAATNRDGLYLLPRLQPGRYAVRVSFVGYVPYTDTLQLARDENRTLSVTLTHSETALDEVVVAEERGGGPIPTAGQQTIRPADIRRIPTPDVTGDLAGYLTTMPSVVTTADRGGQLFIRGGEPSQNLVLLDGMTVYQPFHLLGFYSAFPTAIIGRTDLYAGGFGAEYGGRLSSVIDVAARTGNKRRVSGALAASPFLVSAQAEGPIVPGRISFLASGRRSVLERGAERMLDQELPFIFGDAFAKVHARLTGSSRLAVSALHTRDRGTLGVRSDPATPPGTPPPGQVRWKNRGVSVRYLALPRLLPVVADAHVAFSKLHTTIGPAGDPVRSSEIQTTRVTLDATFPGYRTNIRTGLMGNFTRSANELGGLYQNVSTEAHATLDHFALYLEPEFEVGTALRVRPGLRLQFLQSRFNPYPTPRLRLIWERGLHRVSAAGGLYYQEIIGLSDRRDAANVFTAWTHIPKQLEPRPEDVRAGRTPRAVHGILGYRAVLHSGIEVSVEGFYKHLSDLFIAEWTAFPRLTTRLQPADGRSFGAEVRLEARRGAFYGYVGYGYANTIYRAQQASLELWYGTEALRFRPPHDRRHQLSILASFSRWGFDASVRWQFGSGRPFNRVIGFDGFTLIDDIEDAKDLPGSRRVVYAAPFDGLLPTYHRLDASVERSFALGNHVELAAQATVVNAYDRRNIFYLDTFTLERADQLPITPSLGLSLRYR